MELKCFRKISCREIIKLQSHLNVENLKSKKLIILYVGGSINYKLIYYDL